jgi:hypothetical protein
VPDLPTIANKAPPNSNQLGGTDSLRALANNGGSMIGGFGRVLVVGRSADWLIGQLAPSYIGDLVPFTLAVWHWF